MDEGSPNSGNSTQVRCAWLTGSPDRFPDHSLRGVALDDRVPVGANLDPSPLLSVRPLHPNLNAIRLTHTEVRPPALAAGMASPDGDLRLEDPVADADLDPGADGVDVGRRLAEVEGYPVAHRPRAGFVAPAHVSPEPDVLPSGDLDQVEHPVEVEVGQCGPSRSGEVHDPGLRRRLGEGPVRVAQQQVAGVSYRIAGLLLDIPLRHEQIDQGVVVDVGELGMPGRRRG